ncbi:MAG TPA: hypothetical protein V6D35_04950 [Candidatus Sericytochromatia bacterium]|jgi:hypothetical protein
MIRQLLVVLGIGAGVVGYSSTASAQSPMPSGSPDASVTLSGESLRRIEGRTITGDYRTFFNQTLPTTQTNSVTNVGRLSQSQQRSVLGDQVDVVVGDTLTPDPPLTSFPSSDAGDTDRVRVQLQLGNQ